MPSPNTEFYPPEFTERSRSVLHRVHDTVPDAVLIGGWATWVRTGGAMSHDIDLIVTRPQLEAVSTLVEEMSESRHIAGRKWRGSIEGIHLDLYVPYESRLGQHLQLRTELLIDHREHVDDWVVLDTAAHLATKLAALLDRPDSTPGDKDRQEIMALLALEIDPTEAVRVIHDASARTPDQVDQHLKEAFGYLGDMTLDQVQRRWLTRLAAEWAAASREVMKAHAPNRDTPHHRPPTREPPGPTLGR
jgi:hypothetical protein